MSTSRSTGATGREARGDQSRRWRPCRRGTGGPARAPFGRPQGCHRPRRRPPAHQDAGRPPYPHAISRRAQGNGWETIEVAENVFAGSVNKGLVRGLGDLGVQAAGISGTDGPTLLVEPVPDLGRVGKVV